MSALTVPVVYQPKATGLWFVTCPHCRERHRYSGWFPKFTCERSGARFFVVVTERAA